MILALAKQKRPIGPIISRNHHTTANHSRNATDARHSALLCLSIKVLWPNKPEHKKINEIDNKEKNTMENGMADIVQRSKVKRRSGTLRLAGKF